MIVLLLILCMLLLQINVSQVKKMCVTVILAECKECKLFGPPHCPMMPVGDCFVMLICVCSNITSLLIFIKSYSELISGKSPDMHDL